MPPKSLSTLAQENHKAHKRLLEKGNINHILPLLPELHEQAFKTIDCLQCANCCKNHSPRFKQPDIKRIAKYLKIKEGDLVQQYLKIDEDGDYVLQSTPCAFLNDDNTCKIYDVRPSDCSRYPYTDEDVFIKRKTITLKNATVCPITFYVLQQLCEKIVL
ncbi:MAG: YkgJ family cysteine cluster protein [Chitinophagia bacterium]|nr:YkgJ family cysteine cluster protein [Chitinophagia bacterium]